jgi:glycosyltransferase involved in cell wall biosynthesis
LDGGLNDESNTYMSLKVLYIVPLTRTFAGIERVVDEICSELAEKYQQDFEIDVLHFSSYKNFVVGDRKYNKIQEDISSRRQLLRVVRTHVAKRKYDLVVVPQVEATVIFWFACFGLGTKFVAYLHGNPHRERSHTKAKILFFLMENLVINRLAGVFGTSPRQLESFKVMCPSKIPHYWVPNPVRKFSFADEQGLARDPGIITFVNVGRFSYQKGQDVLLTSFSKLYAQRRNVRLKVVGYGNEEPDLRNTITELGLQTVVSIEHYPENPQAALLTSDVYVSTSRWEGWSLAICEALRFGLPVVATDCEFGPSDILVDRRLGLLVPPLNEDELLKAMLYYCDNMKIEKVYSEFRKAFIDRYSVEKVVHIHADALTSLLKR